MSFAAHASWVASRSAFVAPVPVPRWPPCAYAMPPSLRLSQRTPHLLQWACMYAGRLPVPERMQRPVLAPYASAHAGMRPVLVSAHSMGDDLEGFSIVALLPPARPLPQLLIPHKHTDRMRARAHTPTHNPHTSRQPP